MDIPVKESKLKDFIKSPKSALWKLALPMMAGMSVQSIYMLVDTAFIGHWVGGDALASLGYIFPIFFIILGITFGLGTGVTTVIAQFIGAEDKKSADNSAEHSILLASFLSLFILIGGNIFGAKILALQGATGQALEFANEYYPIMLIGSVFMVFAVFFRSILSGEGDNKMPMMVLGIGTVLNIILDPIFIYYYGIKGAAIATMLSQIIVCLIFIYMMFFKKHSYITFALKDFSFKSSIFSKIFKLGIPASLSMVIISMGAILFNKILDSTDAVAAYQTAGRLEHMFFLPIISIAHALVTLTGMFYGAKRIDLLNEVIYYGLKVGLGFSFVFALLFYFLSAPMIGWFTESQEIINIGSNYFHVLIFAFPLITIGMTSSRIMQGMGYASPMLIITLMRVILISGPLAWYFTRVLGKPIEFVWYSMFISAVFSSITAFVWMRKIISRSLIEKNIMA
jgi:putative MATE family efflux protein